MEKSIHQAYSAIAKIDLRSDYRLVREYPLKGKPPIMTHVFENGSGNEIIAAKGAPEAILVQSALSDTERNKVLLALESLTSKGYRVLGVGLAEHVKEFPQSQNEFSFNFKGLVAFYDPPKENITNVLKSFYTAGIKVKIITGDNSKTTATIARQINFKDSDKMITGDLLMEQSDDMLTTTVANTAIFARMFPEAKLRVIQALKKQGEIVAMTGDGVNDGPALKAANIGIAMGHKGSEIAKQASALILADDNLERMVDAIAAGRKIYNNLKKAIQYIISIHIPIILIVFIPLVLGWLYPVIFSPVHVIFLELIMGPTCSIIYENEPMEKDTMERKPKVFVKTFFDIRELSTSIVQGLMITAGLISIYWYAVNSGQSLPTTTSMVFITLITANIILTLVNRSFTYSLLTTLKYKNNLIPLVIATTMLMVIVIFAIAPLREFFRFETPSFVGISASIFSGLVSVIWFEGYKSLNRFLKRNPDRFPR
jgi:Ca2+-transporting ATPase